MAEQATGKASATETAQEPEAARITDAAAETAQEPGASEDAGTEPTSSPSRRSSRASGTDKGTTGGKRTSSGTGRKPSGGRAGAGSPGAKVGQKAPAEKDHQEVEWQFDADALGLVEGWLRESAVGSGVVLGTVSSDDLVDGYYDTRDWRLYRAGYALRIRETRSGTEATMKSLSGAEGNLRRRREISEPLKDAEIRTLRKSRGPVGEKLRLLLGDREAARIFQVRTSRKTFPLSLAVEASDGATSGSSSSEIVQDASGNVREVSGDGGASGVGGSGRVGEVVLDSSEIPFGEAEEATGLTRVEVEVDAGAASDRRLRGFVKEMEVSLGLRPARISKYEAGIFATGLSPESREDYGPTRVDASLSLGEMAFAVLRQQFAVMGSHEPGTRLGEDAEELHDMRVATRRLRAAMKLFEDVLPERSRWLREELRHFAGSLGAVRDLDVQIEEVQGVGGGDQEEVEALTAIVTGLGERREAARKRLLETLDSDRYTRFESSFAEMLRRGPEGSGDGGIPGAPSTDGSSEASADTPVLEAAPALLGRRYRTWSKAAGRLHEGSHPEEYHDLRKKGKRLRYALEFFSGVYGEEATGKLVRPLKAVQDSLGRHQDATVAADLLHEIAINTPRLPKRTVFAMGLLAQRYHAEAEALRTSSTAAKEYRALAGGKLWKGFEKLMKGESRAAEKFRKGSGKGKKKGK